MKILNITQFNRLKKINKPLYNLKIKDLTKIGIKEKDNEEIMAKINDWRYPLDVLSPKYLTMLKRINKSKGLIFCYSQFRAVEGIEIFTRVLEEAGYDKIIIAKKGSRSKGLKVYFKYKLKNENITMYGKIIGIGKEGYKIKTLYYIKDDIEYLYNEIIYIPEYQKGSVHIIKDGGEFLDKYFIQMDTKIRVGNMVRYTDDDNQKEWKTGKVVHIIKNKIKILVENDKLKNIFVTINRSNVKRARFALWTGNQNEDERIIIRSIYTKIDNLYGQLITILLTTESGAEGISLKAVRQVHIMEPYWNMVRIYQVIGRARRVRSHINLLAHQQDVHVFMYISQLSKNQKNLNILDSYIIEKELINSFKNISKSEITKEMIHNRLKIYLKYIIDNDNGKTSDEELYTISIKKKVLIDSFLKLFKTAAVDCYQNKDKNKLTDTIINDINFRCKNNIISEDKTYSYMLEDSLESLGDTKLKILEKDVFYKYIPVTINNEYYGKYKIIAKIENMEDNMEYKTIKNIPNNTIVLDFYEYFMINPYINPIDKNEIQIGNIIDGDIIFKNMYGRILSDKEVEKKILNMIAIEQYLSSENIIISEIQELITKQDSLNQLRNDIQDQLKWKCYICSKINNSDNKYLPLKCLHNNCIGKYKVYLELQ